MPSDSQEQERGGHTSLYERAFGRGSAEFPADCMSAPLYEHGGGGSMEETPAYSKFLTTPGGRSMTAGDDVYPESKGPIETWTPQN